MAACQRDVRIQGVATALLVAANVDTNPKPSMASEDFAFMLQAKPGCYI